MQVQIKKGLKGLVLLGLVSLLNACVFAPGMRMSERHAVEMAESGDVSAVKAITPELLQSEKTLREQLRSQDLGPLLGKTAPYQIGSGDILSIVVWDHPEMVAPPVPLPAGGDSGSTPGFVVNREGFVQFPLVGLVKLSGLTEVEARNLLLRKLARYIKGPDLTLRVQAYRSQRIYIDGEVKTPGALAINDVPMTLLEAVNRAGGFLPSADQSRVNISRTGKTYEVSLPQLVQKGVNPADILLANGDVVRVVSREESKVFVLGEVSKPASLPMRNGRLTLNEALGDAGGLSPLSSNGQQVYVVRHVKDKAPAVYHLDAGSPVALALAEGFELQPKDVVYVDATSLVLWSRVINLIVPTAQTVYTTDRIGK